MTICFFVFCFVVLNNSFIYCDSDYFKKGIKPSETLPNVPEQRYLKKRRQATQMAAIILVLFYICVIPYTVLRFEKL